MPRSNMQPAALQQPIYVAMAAFVRKPPYCLVTAREAAFAGRILLLGQRLQRQHDHLRQKPICAGSDKNILA